MTDVLERAIHDLIYDAQVYWPDDTYFHRRNRQKLSRAWSKLAPMQGLSRSAVVDQFIDILQWRNDHRVPTVYAMSNGGSGCHFLGQLLDGLSGLHTTDEVYFPSRLLREILASGGERDALAVDFINFFHAGTVDPEHHDLKIVNIGHLHPDTPPAHLAKVDVHGHFVLLIRNPYDVAVSRAFRKPGYRAQAAPGMSDDEYLQRQVNGTKAFLSRAQAFQWHNVVRYEDLTTDPMTAVGPLVRGLDMRLNEEEFEAARRILEASSKAADSPTATAGNLNTRPQEPLTATQIEILRVGLSDLASEFGYEDSELMIRSIREQALRGARRPAQPLLTGSSEHALQPWLPQHVMLFHYNEARFSRLDQGYLTVSNYLPEIELPTDSTWNADPFGNKTWRLFYHSLNWLLAYAWGVDYGDDPEKARQRIGDTATRYLEANVFSAAVDDFAWDDHTTADRLSILTFVWACYLDGPVPLVDATRVRTACEIHVEKLVEFYESKLWLNSNHGLLHALALLNFATTFDTSRLVNKARAIGSDYLTTVVANLVDIDEGVALEQSLSYHQFDLRLLRSAHEFLSQAYPELARLLDGVTNRMVDFNLCVRTSADIMPAIGDTHLGAKLYPECLSPAPGEEMTDHLAYIESRGGRGTPFPPLVVYPNSGYSVFRRGEVFDGDVTRGIFLHHPERVAHGHFDALSLSLHFAGRDVLVDSGGPYIYGNALRFSYFMASRAHNVVLVDDRDHRAPAGLVGHGGELDCQWVTAEHSGYEGRTVSRTVVAVAEAGFVIFDSITGGRTVSTFDMLWHFSPECRVLPVANGRRATADIRVGEDRFVAHGHLSDAATVEVVEGRLAPTPQGWVTETPETKRPAPVLITSARATDLLAVTVFVRQGTPVLTKVSGSSASVKLGGRKISFSVGTPPRITQPREWPIAFRPRSARR